MTELIKQDRVILIGKIILASSFLLVIVGLIGAYVIK